MIKILKNLAKNIRKISKPHKIPKNYLKRIKIAVIFTKIKVKALGVKKNQKMQNLLIEIKSNFHKKISRSIIMKEKPINYLNLQVKKTKNY